MKPFIFVHIAAGQRMQKIIVEIARTRPLQAGRQLLLGHVFRQRSHGIELCCQGIGVPGIPLNKGFPCCNFRTRINIRRIEIGTARLKEQVHHFFGLFDINSQTFSWKAHQAKTKL